MTVQVVIEMGLECVDISKTILDVGINNKLGKMQNFAAQVKRLSKTRLFPLSHCESHNRLQVHVVIEMEIVQIL